MNSSFKKKITKFKEVGYGVIKRLPSVAKDHDYRILDNVRNPSWVLLNFLYYWNILEWDEKEQIENFEIIHFLLIWKAIVHSISLYPTLCISKNVKNCIRHLKKMDVFDIIILYEAILFSISCSKAKKGWTNSKLGRKH